MHTIFACINTRKEGSDAKRQSQYGSAGKGCCPAHRRSQEAIAHGGDIENAIRNLTLKAMHSNGLDIESLKQIATAVMKGVQEGAQQKMTHAAEQSHAAQSQITQAVVGLILLCSTGRGFQTGSGRSSKQGETVL